MMTDQAQVRVLLLESIHPDAVSRLESAGYQVESVRNALDEVELIERIPGVQLLGIRSKTQVTAKVLEAADSLVAIGAFCIGTDQIDLGAAAASGIAVFNAPFSNTRSVVELAIAEIISMTRRLTEKNALMHSGVWDKSADGAPRDPRPAGSASSATATSVRSCRCSPRTSACTSRSTTPPTSWR